jgi:Asp-tRNA(Asn)/Glu-tRNA(Gln) amidotransferase B subunit
VACHLNRPSCFADVLHGDVTGTSAILPELERVIAEVIANNPKQVEQYRGGKTAVINFLVGQVMRATRGQANVAAVTDLLKRNLGSESC